MVAAKLGQLETAAAEVGGDAGHSGEGREHAPGAGERFLLAGQQPRRQAGRAHRLEELGTVARVAHRRGRHDFDVVDADDAQQRRVARQRRQRDAHGLVAQQPAAGDVLAEPGRDLFVEHHAGRARRPVVDHQAHRVRADVDDRVLLAHAGPVLRSEWLPRIGSDVPAPQ